MIMSEENVILVKFVKLQHMGDHYFAIFKHPKQGPVYWTKGYIQDLLTKPLDPRNQSELQKAIDEFDHKNLVEKGIVKKRKPL